MIHGTLQIQQHNFLCAFICSNSILRMKKICFTDRKCCHLNFPICFCYKNVKPLCPYRWRSRPFHILYYHLSLSCHITGSQGCRLVPCQPHVLLQVHQKYKILRIYNTEFDLQVTHTSDSYKLNTLYKCIIQYETSWDSWLNLQFPIMVCFIELFDYYCFRTLIEDAGVENKEELVSCMQDRVVWHVRHRARFKPAAPRLLRSTKWVSKWMSE